MSFIRNITIEGFRSIKSVKDLELRPLNLLIGANGSGKSNFLGALRVLAKLGPRIPSFEEYVERAGGANRLLYFSAKTTQSIKYKVEFQPNAAASNVDFEAEMSYGTEDRLYPTFKVNLDPAHFKSSESKERPKAPPQVWKEKLDSWRQFHFHDTGDTSPMKTTVDINNNRELSADGANLAGFLLLLREKHEQAYGLIEKTIQQVAPFFAGFILEPQARNERMILLKWKHKGTDAYFDAHSISDGTLRFIALTTLLLQPVSLRPSLIMIDEPELGLHPFAIHLLASMLKQASVDSQIIAATQSPILLDHFDPEDVLVAERVAGATEFRRLDAERLAAWLEDYSLGELWEKNELGGRPEPERIEGPTKE